jgi:serine/threonine-protein kinase RsbW
MPSDIKAISPLVDQLIRLIEESHCVVGEELAVELALQEALSNAVVHGNRLDPGKLVHVRCRCELGKGVSIFVRDLGTGFDPNAIPDPLAAENIEVERGRGLLLMLSQMDEVSFQCGGTEVHMVKRVAREPKRGPRISSESDRHFANTVGPRVSDIGKQLRPMRTREKGTC